MRTAAPFPIRRGRFGVPPLEARRHYLLLFCLLGALLAGCDRKPAPPARQIKSLHLLGVYATEAQTLAAEFEQQTGIGVKIIGATISSLREKELTDLVTRGGNYDVMQVPYQWEGEILPHLRPLDDVVSRIAPDLADLIPGVRTNCGQWGAHKIGRAHV